MVSPQEKVIAWNACLDSELVIHNHCLEHTSGEGKCELINIDLPSRMRRSYREFSQPGMCNSLEKRGTTGTEWLPTYIVSQQHRGTVPALGVFSEYIICWKNCWLTRYLNNFTFYRNLEAFPSLQEYTMTRLTFWLNPIEAWTKAVEPLPPAYSQLIKHFRY